MKIVDRETISGKPFFGIWCGIFGPYEDINSELLEQKLIIFIEQQAKSNNLEIRHITTITKPPIFIPMVTTRGTVAIKYVMWGRAFNVMRTTKQKSKIKIKRKIRVNGRFRWRNVVRAEQQNEF